MHPFLSPPPNHHHCIGLRPLARVSGPSDIQGTRHRGGRGEIFQTRFRVIPHDLPRTEKEGGMKEKLEAKRSEEEGNRPLVREGVRTRMRRCAICHGEVECASLCACENPYEE